MGKTFIRGGITPSCPHIEPASIPYLFFVPAIAGVWRSHMLSLHWLRSTSLACFPIKPSYKKRHPRKESCCLHVGQQFLQLQCPQRDDPCPAEGRISGRWSQSLAEGPRGLRCCCHNSGCGCCTGAGGCWCFHYPAETETKGGFGQLRRDNSNIKLWKHWKRRKRRQKKYHDHLLLRF